MIDFVKANVSVSRLGIIVCTDGFTFETVNTKTNDKKKYKFAEFDNMKFLFKGNYAELRGSLHKFKNSGYHNYNDFTFQEVEDTLEAICDTFDIDASSAIIQNLEFGVNLEIPFCPIDFLKRRLITYKNRSKNRSMQIDGRGWMVEYILSNHIFKLYDKGGQYDRPNKILRIEIKTKRTSFIKSTGIRTLSDLKNKDKLLLLVPILQKAYSELLIVDDISNVQIESHDKIFISERLNPKYYELRMPQTKNYPKRSRDRNYYNDRKKYYTDIAKLKQLINLYNLNKTDKLVHELLVSKCEVLSS